MPRAHSSFMAEDGYVYLMDGTAKAESWANKPWGSASKQMPLLGTTRRQSLTDSLKCVYIWSNTHNTGEGNGNPLQYSCLENPHGQRILAGYSLWDRRESDTTKRLTHTQMHNIELTILTIFKCTIQWPSVPSWPNAITTHLQSSVHLHKLQLHPHETVNSQPLRPQPLATTLLLSRWSDCSKHLTWEESYSILYDRHFCSKMSGGRYQDSFLQRIYFSWCHTLARKGVSSVPRSNSLPWMWTSFQPCPIQQRFSYVLFSLKAVHSSR